MKLALFLDIGSTYTKGNVIDFDNLKLIGASKTLTTVDDNIMTGITRILADLSEQGINEKHISYRIASSSAAGGLKIVASGLVPELTAEAAKRAALGAGAKVSKVYSYELTDTDVEEIIGLKPDLFLLVGGTDGGKKDIVINNAHMLAKSSLDIPIIMAGNKTSAPEVYKILAEHGKECHLTENVMPVLEKLNIEPASKMIRTIFLRQIVYAKGFHKVKENFGNIIMPTPSAVMQAAELLAAGTNEHSGLGEVMIVDIGGATTDVHSAAEGTPSKGVSLKGLEEPFVKRTVEGDLGMRYSAPSLLDEVGDRALRKYVSADICTNDLRMYIYKLSKNVEYLPKTSEKDMEFALAKAAIDIAVSRHAGKLEVHYTPFGESYVQRGKDLTDLELIIGTGGVLVHNQDTEDVIRNSFVACENPEILAPCDGEVIIDREYLLSTIGLLSNIDEERAIQFAKKHLSI